MRWALLAGVLACGEGAAAAPPPPAITTGSSPAPGPSAPPAAPPAVRQAPIRLLFAGDVAMSLKVGILLEKRAAGDASVAADFPFTHVGERIAAADLAIGNLECVVSLRGAKDTNHNPLRCPLSSIDDLKRAGFDLMSVANNHVMDFGRGAFDDMLKNLDTGGMPHFGKEVMLGKPQPPFVRTIRGVRVGLIAAYDPPDSVRNLKAARGQADVLIVFNHWGLEGQPEPILQQRKLGREQIDAGADLVVGTHAHVLQPNEWYEGKLIAYGLGNFVFSGMSHNELNRVGAMLEIDIDPETRALAYRMQKIRLDERGEPHLHGPAEPMAPP